MSKKDEAFALFERGCNALSPEVKALGLKSQTRYNYFLEYKQGAGGGQSKKVSQTLTGGEAIGTIDETKNASREAVSPKLENQREKEEAGDNELGEGREAIPEEDLEPEEATSEKPPSPDEGIGAVSEVMATKGKDGKYRGAEVKIATTIADDGIKCTIFLSLQTLALFRIAASTQAQVDGDDALTLGDFLDTCAEDFFMVRGKKLGLISSGGK